MLPEGASICLEIAMGVPDDAHAEEKDAKMGIGSSCGRHNDQKVHEGSETKRECNNVRARVEVGLCWRYSYSK